MDSLAYLICVLHRVRVDDAFATLAFASEGDADRFCKFIGLYQERGGNGYNAYWIFSRDIQYAKTVPNGAERSLEPERIELMALSILEHRGVDIELDYTPPIVGRKNGVITFDWALLGEKQPAEDPTGGTRNDWQPQDDAEPPRSRDVRT